jgi:hypothetical protein
MGKWWKWNEQLRGLLGRGEASRSIAHALHMGNPIERSRIGGRALLHSVQEASHGAHQRRASPQAALAQAQWLIATPQRGFEIREESLGFDVWLRKP